MDDVHGAELSKPDLYAVTDPAVADVAGDPVVGDLAAAAEQRYRTLSVIVPVFNERNTIAEILRRIRAVDLPMHLEVVVVDDGSTDGTGKVLSALEDSTVRIVTHSTNQGKGAAVRTGVKTARGQLVLIQDGDLEYDPDDWPKLLEPVMKGKAQVVYGSRFTGAGRAMRPTQWLGNRLLTITANVLYRSTLSDMETGYKLFDRAVLDAITIESDGFDFEPEITAKVLRRGYRIYEVPVSYTGRDPSEGTKFDWRDGVRAFTALVRYRFIRHI
ncbi:MAG TPA: glycosyltransferase family 2 protein [Acidimicrobiales bacterium]|nr:glycosyltransferase family 2 protein [Acidimicrobiales bacterium]